MKNLNEILLESLFDSDLIEKHPFKKIDWRQVRDLINNEYENFKKQHKDIHINNFYIYDPDNSQNYKYAAHVCVNITDTTESHIYDYICQFSFTTNDKKIILGNPSIEISIKDYSNRIINHFDIGIFDAISWKVRDPKNSDILNIYKFIDNFFNWVYKIKTYLKDFLDQNINDSHTKLQEKLHKQCYKWFKL